MNPRAALPLIILFFLLCPLFSDQRQVVQTGHTGEVRDVQWQQDGNILVSAGTDGSLRVWKNSNLIYTRQVSHLPLTSLAIHPAEPVCVFIATDNINTYRLIAYNWESGRELYSFRLDELPLDISFSPKGSYLFFSRTDQHSLTLLDALSGAPLPVAEEGFGIVSAAFISESEQTLVCYLASGSILYWDIEKNQQKAAPISTTSNLDMLEFSATGRYAVGCRGDNLYLIDLVTGRTLSSLELSGIIAQAAHPRDLKTAFIRNTGRFQEIVEIDYSDRSLKESFHLSIPQGRPLSLAYSLSTIYVGMENGSLGSISEYSPEFNSWGNNELADLTDIDIWNGSLAITSPGTLSLIDSQQFRSSNPVPPQQFQKSTVTLPFNQEAGFLPLNSRTGVLWNRQSPGNTWEYSLSDGKFIELFSVDAACKEIYTFGDSLLSLDQNGSIIIYDMVDKEIKYHYTGSGIRDVTFVDEETIIAGRNPSRRFPSPIMRINLRTGETVPLEAADMLTYSLHFDPLTGSLFTLGLQERRGRIMTVLRQLQGSNFERDLPLLSYPGEDHNATFILDTLRIFTSLGHSGVQISGWNGFSSLGDVSHIPLRISSDNRILATLNSDSSISIWNKTSGKWLCDFYLFSDGEWAALTPNSGIVTSTFGSRHVRSFNN